MIEATYIDHMGSDLSVVNAARVSFGKVSEEERLTLSYQEFEWGDYTGWKQKEWFDDPYYGVVLTRLSQRDTSLVKYLAKHKHLSPFGHAFASFHVKAPVFVARQLVKHKFLRWNEISRRYVDDEPEFYEPEWRSRSADKKQGSGGPMEISLDSEMLFHATCRNALTTYDRMIKEGVAPEQARSILPQNMVTEWYWSGSLDAFADMCRLRLPSDTQQETRVVAQQISEEMSKLFPVSWGALMKGPE